ncbi:MAG: DEAD/DEAH box helicase [Planctomycetia bacterium]|nr:DEAD/DEAH box helicase [Planctomycetia bacterium]
MNAEVPAAAPPAVRTVPLLLSVRTLASGMQSALARPIALRTRQAVFPAPPKVVSLPIPRTTVKTHGFVFEPSAQSPLQRALASVNQKGPTKPLIRAPLFRPATPDANARRRAARIRPPGDVVKLQDRLFYLLQPPVETWMARENLSFPHEPFPYQYEGVAFLYPRDAAILADEMGLGKTMQAITAMRLLLHAREIRSALLVCPKPLVPNWKREFSLWAPEIPVVVVEGDQARRRWQWGLPVAVKIANYEILQRDRDLLADPALRFDLVILDEAQRIKNRESTTAEVSRSIHRTRSWTLTGTPVENSVSDLVGIFDFLAPGHLSTEMKPQRIGELAADFVLRRTKEQVLSDMPPKLERDVEVELSPEQRETYRLAEEEGVLRLTELGPSITIQHVFELVLRLKQICNFDPATGESAKLERLLADLEEVATSGRKALVFSQWVSTLLALRAHLEPLGPLEYHGRIPSSKREEVIRRFRDDPSRHVLLISYGAGGVGLNLQCAGYVFLFDRWWNPAVEDQAINRAHRIGISGPVTVSRYLSPDTIEQRIDEVLSEKRQLFETIFQGDAARRDLGLTQEEIFGLFRLKGPRAAA